VVLLHCVVQPESDGGESEVTDGLAVCERLRNADERHYKTLSTVPVTWIDRGQDGGYRFSNVNRAPVVWQVFDSAQTLATSVDGRRSRARVFFANF